MNCLLEDLLEECKACNRKSLPLVLKNVMSQLDLDDIDIEHSLRITHYDLEDIMYNDKKMDAISFIKLKRRLYSLVKRQIQEFEHLTFGNF